MPIEARGLTDVCRAIDVTPFWNLRLISARHVVAIGVSATCRKRSIGSNSRPPGTP
jgi:hypothetical protein